MKKREAGKIKDLGKKRDKKGQKKKRTEREEDRKGHRVKMTLKF